jgi:glycine dehydrogenase subunit 2
VTIFELSKSGRTACPLQKRDVEEYKLDPKFLREADAMLPEVDELTLVRHYTALSKKAFGVDDGFYPLGSCTMKYNPKINEAAAALSGFTNIHPLQDQTQGALRLMWELSRDLCAITGMDMFTLQPAAGAHGEFTALLMIKAYHNSRNDHKRNKVIAPDSAHGTNPASAAMAGFEIINIPSSSDGLADLEALEKAVGEDTAAFMLTNPNTLGIFDKNIKKIADIVHKAGGLLYYDGANLNPIMGIIRPGDMGFDVVHLNLHKTFSAPHGGGGPGSGPVGCKKLLAEFLPWPTVEEDNGVYRFSKPHKSIGSVKAFYGNFLVLVKAFAYIKTLGKDGIRNSAKMSALNANYLMARLKEYFPCHSQDICMHEFVISCEELKQRTGVSALDLAKAMQDKGMHPPTMYFPLIVKEALMFEPTETESKETLDNAADIIIELCHEALNNPQSFHEKPLTTPIGRPDEVKAARFPVLKG